MKLSVKISLWILVIIVISGFLSLVGTVYFQRETSTRDFKEFGSSLASIINDDLRHDMLEVRRDHILPMLKLFKKQQRMINEVIIYSWDHKITLSAEEKDIGKEITDDEVLEVLKSGKRIEREEQKYGKQEFCILIPVKNDKACQSCHSSEPSTIGVIEIGLDMTSLSAHLERDANTATMLLLITCLVILISVLIFLRQIILKRLSLILESIQRFAAGNYTKRVEIRSSDELGLLGRAFNKMADEIQGTIDKLKQTQQRLDRSLIRFGRLLATTLDLEKLPGLIVNELADSVKSPEASILLRGDDNKLMLTGAKGISSDLIEEYNSHPDVWEEGSLELATLESLKYVCIDESFSVNQTQGKLLFSKIASLHKNEDFYIFPLFGSEQIVGLLTLALPLREHLDEGKIQTLQLLCQETATAIENSAMHKFLETASITDELTQIYNQRHFFHTLKEEMDRGQRYDQSFCLLFLDLDRFKLFNDSFGHRVGNQILRQVSQIIVQVVRSSDKVFRYGGDEFALILPNASADEAIILAQRIREEIEKTDFAPDEQEVSFVLSASVGIVSYDGNRFKQEDEIFKAVDDALHKAKNEGRNRVVVG